MTMDEPVQPLWRRPLVRGIFLACILLAGLAGWQLLRPQPSGLPVLPLGGDFVLTDTAGKPFAMSSLRGHIVLLNFGYTHCPDVCPLTLARYRAVLRDLGAKAASLQTIMISVDPDRDTPETLGTYVRYFDPRIIGLTGSHAALSVVEHRYGAVVSLTGSGDKTEVSHSDYLYLIDDLGRVRRLYSQEDGVATISAEVRGLIDEAKTR